MGEQEFSLKIHIQLCISIIGLVTMLAVLLCSLVAVVQCVPSTHNAEAKLSVADKLKLTQDIQGAEVIKDVEHLVEGLDDVTLAKLEKILSDDLTTDDELQLIQDELTEMGMDVEDIQDLLDLATLMTEFLSKVPDVEKVVVGEDGYSVEDNAKLYLLGLPNKLGPLGFLALHSVLESDESNIVDVKIGSFEPADINNSANNADGSVVPLGDDLARRKTPAAAAKSNEDLVADILARRRRAIKPQPGF